MAEEFAFNRQGRTPRTVAILIAIYSVLVAAIILIDAAWWIMAALALLTLPALWDLWRDPSAGVRLNAERLDWYTGRHSGSLALHEIDLMRFDTRMDFSVRITAILHDDTRVRLPYDALPPHRVFEKSLETNGVTVERHHFSIF